MVLFAYDLISITLLTFTTETRHAAYTRQNFLVLDEKLKPRIKNNFLYFLCGDSKPSNSDIIADIVSISNEKFVLLQDLVQCRIVSWKMSEPCQEMWRLQKSGNEGIIENIVV